MDAGTAAAAAAAAAVARGAGATAAREAATALDRRAGELRELRLRLAALGELPWSSPAADAFRRRLDGHLLGAGDVAARCEAAAALLRLHAEAVDGASAGDLAAALRGGPTGAQR